MCGTLPSATTARLTSQTDGFFTVMSVSLPDSSEVYTDSATSA